jgi:sulfur-carrier protein adenylyltransferase/sulfurtransferase
MNEQTVPPGLDQVQLSREEIRRYGRHLLMPEVGLDGQKKLKSSSVLLIGAGGLGSPLAMYLAAAGVGTIGVVDFDVVDYSNLQRQILHGTADVGRPKIQSAAERIHSINPYVKVDLHDVHLSSENALQILKDYDVVVDGTDNFPTRYLVNDACVLLHKPNVYGSIFRFEGQVSVFHADKGPCYRCLYAEPPPPGLVPSCAEGGVLGVLPGIIGTIQALETIKLLLGIGDPLIGRLLLFDALGVRFNELKLRKNPACPICGTNATIHELIDYQAFCGITPPVFGDGHEDSEITVDELKRNLDRRDAIVLLDVREPHEYQIANLGGKLIPLNDLPKRVHELDSSDEIVVYCASGIRSGKAVKFLKEVGFKKVKNLVGGINAWADKIDQTMPVY